MVIEVAGAGRYDISFTMPENPVRIGIATKQSILTTGRLLNGNDIIEEITDIKTWPYFDPGKYSKPLDTPWWADTLNVKPGEEYTVAFHADNPGMWMNHCHNLDHANVGMTLHVSYINVTSPYNMGIDTPNKLH